jgi:starch phosphorylase
LGQHHFEVEVNLSDLEPGQVSIELFADRQAGEPCFCQEMLRLRKTDSGLGLVYGAKVPANRPPEAFTARAIPHGEGLLVPLEEGHILWQS